MSPIEIILVDKSIKPKEKTERVSNLLLSHSIELTELIEFARTSKDPVKATCIEALEYASKQNPELITKKCFDFVCENLKAKSPRIKWESAKVIGNVAKNFSGNLDYAIEQLLENTKHEGTVVRWSAAFALGEILKLKNSHYKSLLKNIQTILENEEKNSIKKIYLEAIKKSSK